MTVKMMKIPALLSAAFVSGLAQQAWSAGVLEEVIVTAQHRSESLADVPVSVSAVSGDKLFEAGINKMEDLAAYVPNLKMAEGGVGTLIFIRGIGSGENQGFEQSVGTYVDGVYYGRAQLARAPFLDLAQVEVLRGPQNILYGKNSVGGAISVRTASPSQDSEILASVTGDPEYNEYTTDVVFSGPVNDSFGLRFAMRARQTDGYMINQISNEPEPQREELTARLKGVWDMPSDKTLTVKLEHGIFDVVGRQFEVISDDPSPSDIFLFNGRTYGEIVSDTNAGVPIGNTTYGLVLNEHPSVRDHTPDYRTSRQEDYSNNKTYNLTSQLDWNGDSGGIYNLIFAHMMYSYDELCDCDYTGADLLQAEFSEDYQQTSLEFRWLSDQGDNWEYIGGGYLQYSEVDFQDRVIVSSDLAPQLINAADILEGGARGDIDPGLGNILDPRTTLGIGDAGNELVGFSAPRTFISESTIASAFLQATWLATDYSRVIFGGRYTWERKTGARKFDFAGADGEIMPVGEIDTVAAISFAGERHDLRGQREEGQFAPSLKYQYYPSDDVMLYASWARGYKSGGYDARSNSSPDPSLTPLNPNVLGCTNGGVADGCNQVSLVGSFEYDREEADTVELGSKSSFLGGVAELNMALFYTNFRDLQVSIFDGTLGFNVGNAASAVSYGLEMDGRVALSANWLLAAGISVMSFEYEDHEKGTCVQGQEPDVVGSPTCDYSGKTGQFVATYSGNAVLGYESELTDSLLFRGNIDAIFSDSYNPSPNLDPRVEQEAYVAFNARLSISTIDNMWDLALVGKNLTDERVYLYANDTPMVNTITGGTSHIAVVGPRRSIGMQATYRF
ncbi:TonB-dependent receptor [Zhongshania aliphaticivorans]|nr:TonB-dependent receptor [Zhongshania aliphaticivorans]